MQIPGTSSEAGKRHVADMQSINRVLIEKAMAMRCVSFYADAKARLLTCTVFGMSWAKKSVVALNKEILEAQEKIQLQSKALEERAKSYESLATDLEARVRARTKELEETNAKLKLQQEIAMEAAKKAAESNRAKSSFLANMSHEIRTPLTAILGFGHLIQTTTSDQTIKGFATRIVNNGNRLLDTINGVLDVARIESGKGVVHLVPVDLNAEARRTIELVESLASQKNLKVECTSGVSQVWVTGDLDMIRKILTNIIGNAIKFTNSGKITVHADAVEAEGQSFGRLTVVDTGVGIAPEFMPRLFEEFHQESLGTGRQFEGSGLGLALAKNLLTALNGDIKIDSKKGVGTKVEILLPASQPGEAIFQESATTDGAPYPPSADIATHPPLSPAGKRVGNLRKVLLVDDNQSLLDLFEQFIGPLCELTTAATGSEALAQAHSKKFDLVLMDINLGAGADGIETMMSLRQAPGYSTTPIVALTAYALKGDKERFLKLGFDGFIPKPVSQANLQEAIKSNWLRTPAFKDDTP